MLTAEELCDICGVTPNKRQAWSRDGELRQRRGFEELDAVELTTYAALREIAGPSRAKAAWADLRGELARLLLDTPRDVWIVVEAKGVMRHRLVVRTRDLARAIEHGRPVHVLQLRPLVDAARAAYREVAGRKRTARTAGSVTSLGDRR